MYSLSRYNDVYTCALYLCKCGVPVSSKKIIFIWVFLLVLSLTTQVTLGQVSRYFVNDLTLSLLSCLADDVCPGVMSEKDIVQCWHHDNGMFTIPEAVTVAYAP